MVDGVPLPLECIDQCTAFTLLMCVVRPRPALKATEPLTARPAVEAVHSLHCTGLYIL